MTGIENKAKELINMWYNYLQLDKNLNIEYYDLLVSELALTIYQAEQRGYDKCIHDSTHTEKSYYKGLLRAAEIGDEFEKCGAHVKLLVEAIRKEAEK